MARVDRGTTVPPPPKALFSRTRPTGPGWLGSGDLTDSVHPNDQGHRAVTDRLVPVIAARIGA